MMNTVITAALITLLTGTATVTNINPAPCYVSIEESAISEEDQMIWDEATADIAGFHYMPTQMIEKQIVNGTNYIFIAKSTTAAPNAKPKTVTITIHQSLAGEISIIEIRQL